MPRPKSKAPTLDRKGPDGEYFFHRTVNRKRSRIYTGTSDEQEAIAFRDRAVASESVATELITRKKQNAAKVSRTIAEAIDGLEIPHLTFQEGFDYWLKKNPEQLDNSAQRQKHVRSNCAEFNAWCEDNKLKYMDEISNDIAGDYALYIWNTNIRGTTFNTTSQSAVKYCAYPLGCTTFP